MPKQTDPKRPGPKSPNPDPKNAPEQKRQNPELQNEGEGSRSAARRYNAGLEEAIRDPKRVEELMKEAQRAIDGPDGKELREAEQRGKKANHR